MIQARKLLNQAGVGLLEVVIAVGVFAVLLSLIVSTLSLFGNKIEYVNLKRDVDILEGQLRNSFGADVSCRTNLTSSAPVVRFDAGNENYDLNRVRIFDQGGTAMQDIVPAVPGQIPGSRINVTRVVLTSPTAAEPPQPPVLVNTAGAVRTYAAALEVRFNHTVGGAPALPPIRVTGLTIVADADGANVTNCVWAKASQICATGFYEPTGVPTQGILFSSPGWGGAFGDAFTVISAGGFWGLKCNDLWYGIGCSNSQLKSPPPGTISPQIIMGGNECKSPDSTNDTGARIILTCCQIQ